MLFSSNFITALAQPLPGSRKQEGHGLVERQVGPGTYAIALGREKMSVRVTEGSLTVGAAVTVIVRKDHLEIIEQTLSISPAKGGYGKDSFLQTNTLTSSGLRGALDTLIQEVASAPSDSTGEAFGRSRMLFRAIAADCGKLNSSVTEEIEGLFSAGASKAGLDQTTADAMRALLERLRERLTGPPGVSGGRTVLIPSVLPEGFTAFSNTEAALRFLGTELSPDETLGRELQRMVAEEGAVILRTIAADETRTLAMLLGPDEAMHDLESLPSRFSSPLFRSIPASVFHEVLSDRGSLNVDLLHLLDAQAADLRMPALPHARAGSAPAKEASLLQWLLIASENRCEPASLAATLPAFSASSIIDPLEELSLGRRPLPPPEAWGVTESTVNGAAEKHLLIGSVFRRLGFNLESTLAAGGEIDKGSLKALVLDLLNRTPGYTTAPAAGNRGVPSMSGLIEKIAEFEQSVGLQVDKPLNSAGSLSAPAPLTLPEGDRDAVQAAILAAGSRVRQALTGAVTAACAELALLLNELDSGLRQQEVPPEQPGTGPREPSLEAASLRTEQSRGVDDLLDSSGGRIEALLRKLKETIDLIVRQQQPAGGTGSSVAAQTVQEAVRAAVENVRAAIFQNIEEFRTGCQRTIETILRQREPHQGANVAQGPAAQNPAEGSMVARQEFRQALETVLSRLESLQLLARPTATVSGDQQILALPIKIGGEWTEMQVRFVHRRNHSAKAAERKRFAVYISVAPTFLGSVSARMEYSRKNNFKLVMEFERPDTRAWFLNRKNDIRKAIAGLGIPSPQVEFVAAAKPKEAGHRDDSKTSGLAIIDVKA